MFFDGAKNMQKVGDVITAAYPRAFSLHGVEHVLSLFFFGIARIAQIGVRKMFCSFLKFGYD